MLRVLQVGLGSMGKRRIRNLQELGIKDIIGFDPKEERRKEAQREELSRKSVELFFSYYCQIRQKDRVLLIMGAMIRFVKR